MNYFSIDAIVVYAFLLITLVVGLWAGRNVKTIQEYAIANRTYGTGILTIAFLATYVEAWNLIGFPGDIFADGLIHIVPTVLFGIVACLLFIAKCIAPRMIYFTDCLTMGELMGKFYGNYGRILTGFLGLIYNLTTVSIQIVFLNYVCNLLGINGNFGLILGALILVIYASSGGIKAVTITDIIQFIVIIIALSVVLNSVISQVGVIDQLFSSIPSTKLHFFKFSQEKTGEFGAGYYSFPILAIWFLFPGFPLSFPFIQRMLMARNKQQLVNMYYLGTAFLVILFISLALIGLGMVVLYPQIESGQVIPHLIRQIPLGWLKGLAIIGLLAVIMSTADSFLHSAGLSFAHDIIKPLADKKNIFINELKVTKYATFLIGCLSIIVALTVKNIFKIAIYGMDLAALLFTIPLIAGIMGLKTDARSFFVSFVVTFISFFFGKLFFPESVFIPLTILSNGISFLIAHFIQNKGFSLIHRRYMIMEINTCWNPSLKSLGSSLLLAPITWIKSSIRNTVSTKSNYTLFAFFTTFNYMIPFFMHTYTDANLYIWSLVIRTIGTLLCMGLLLKPYWPNWLHAHLATYWYITLLYCLPFSATFTWILDGGSMGSIIHIGLATMMLMFLVDWANFFVLSSLGITLACLLYKQGGLLAQFNLDFNIQYSLA